jgi:hypothetical protein
MSRPGPALLSLQYALQTGRKSQGVPNRKVEWAFEISATNLNDQIKRRSIVSDIRLFVGQLESIAVRQALPPSRRLFSLPPSLLA